VFTSIGHLSPLSYIPVFPPPHYGDDNNQWDKYTKRYAESGSKIVGTANSSRTGGRTAGRAMRKMYCM